MNGHALCPFCESPVVKGGVEFGGSILHDECYAELQNEMDEVSVVDLNLENDENGQEAA